MARYISVKIEKFPPQVVRNVAIIGGVIGAIILCLIISLCVYCKRKRRGSLPTSNGSKLAAKQRYVVRNDHILPANLCRRFSFAEIKTATKNFDESLVLGVGGFGKVYRGEIDGGATTVAIKRRNPMSRQGAREFQTEVELLSKLRHRHLVSLIGYCDEDSERVLVYDYMANGTLRQHLDNTKNPSPLSWKRRLQICMESALGLHHLHTGAKDPIIHRDIKTTNILLDKEWVAKVSDFGLSRMGPTLDQTHITTVVKGSFGYLDPEYFRSQQLREKSDVYSFGVVLLEAMCGRAALDLNLPEEEMNLAVWASNCYKKGKLDEIVDPYVKGEITPKCFEKFMELALKCIADKGIERPTMIQVVNCLTAALQMQEEEEVDYRGKKKEYENSSDGGHLRYRLVNASQNEEFESHDDSLDEDEEEEDEDGGKAHLE